MTFLKITEDVLKQVTILPQLLQAYKTCRCCVCNKCGLIFSFVLPDEVIKKSRHASLHNEKHGNWKHLLTDKTLFLYMLRK